MPRKSAAARSAESWRVGTGHPKPRRGMGPAARKLWREIVEARPADFFPPGSLNLLRTFCETSVMLERLGPHMLDAPEDDKLIERMAKLGRMQATLAQKLRLSIQSALRMDAARIKERAEPAKPSAPELLSGKTWREQKQPN